MSRFEHIGQVPHCDQRVLHAPGECEYCDRHPDWQELRQLWGIAFTGHSNDTVTDGRPLLPCPAEKARGMESINSWGGNVAMTPELQKQLDEEQEKIRALFEDGEIFPKEKTEECPADPGKGSFESRRVTASGRPADPDYVDKYGSAPQPIDPVTGQHKDHWVLSETERSKGFIRPVRLSYKHVGVRPKYPTRPLTDEEKIQYAKWDYVAYEKYPEREDSNLVGRFWTQAQLNSGCGTITSMGQAIAETYARDPEFYGSTFCCGCSKYLPVGEQGEFEWLDGSKVGS